VGIHRATGTEARPDEHPPLNSSLSWALSQLLPGREETWLLRALLHRGDRAREAWETLCRRAPEFQMDSGGRKRLSPLLLVALRENGIEAKAPLLTVLRTAYLREELRSRAYREILGEVLATLRRHRLRFLVVKGAALSETVYPDPILRHAHDVDLLVAPRDAIDAAELMKRAGLAPERSLPGDQGRQFRHGSGLPFLLLRRLYRLSYYPADFEALWTGAAEGRVAGVEVRVPGTAEQLLHALGHASYCSSRATLLWVTDAWMLLAAPGGVDWTVFLRRVEESRLELPAYTMVQYLRTELEAAVPDMALAELRNRAARASRASRDVALLGIRQHRGLRQQPTTRQWRRRLDLLRWRLFPSGDYLAWAYQPRPALLPFLYLTRPLGHLIKRLGAVERAHSS
jgi:hypothetical protein